MAYELVKVTLQNVEIQTPLGIKKLKYKINCFCVPFYVPVYRCTWALNYFDNAENGFVSAYRHHPNNDDY
jgi:uracil phosphoribosyltransferase